MMKRATPVKKFTKPLDVKAKYLTMSMWTPRAFRKGRGK